MNLKKMLMLASMALAAIAFAAPAAQASPDWDETGVINGTGELTSVSETGLVTGPAAVEFEGNVEEGSSTGEITSFAIITPAGGIPTNVPGCHAEGTVNNATLPWSVSLTTPDTMIIEGVTFTNDYTAPACQEAGIPPEVDVAGDVTLTIETGNSANANPYEDFGMLKAEEFGFGVDIQGGVAWAGPSITGFE